MPSRQEIQGAAERIRTAAGDARQFMRAEPVCAGAVTQIGTAVISAARVRGGFGGGGGEDGGGEGSGMGLGYGVAGRPVGAFVIAGDEVEWKPAIDVNPILVAGCVAASIFVILRCWPTDRRRRHSPGVSREPRRALGDRTTPWSAPRRQTAANGCQREHRRDDGSSRRLCSELAPRVDRTLRIGYMQTIPRGMPWQKRRTIASRPFGASRPSGSSRLTL